MRKELVSAASPAAGRSSRGTKVAAWAWPRWRAQDLRGDGTILIVDEEQIVRHLARQSLARQGYDVMAAENGAAAIDAVRAQGQRIRLVVLDLSMPDMNGAEALPRLRELRPDLEVLISSGYSEEETLRLFGGVRISGFIQKPYTAHQLAQKVKTALGAGA